MLKFKIESSIIQNWWFPLNLYSENLFSPPKPPKIKPPIADFLVDGGLGGLPPPLYL